MQEVLAVIFADKFGLLVLRRLCTEVDEFIRVLILEEGAYLLRIRRIGIVILIEMVSDVFVPNELEEIGMGKHFEAREAVSDVFYVFCHPLPCVTSAEGIQHGSEDLHGGLGGFSAVLGGDIGHVADEHEGMVHQFCTDILQRSGSFDGITRHLGFLHGYVIATSLLNDLCAEMRVLQGGSGEVKPLRHHALSYFGAVEQVQEGIGIRLFLFIGEHHAGAIRLSVQPAVLTAGYTAYLAVIDHPQVDVMFVIALLRRQFVEDEIDIIPEFVFRVIDHHIGQRVTIVLAEHFLLRLLRHGRSA